MTGRVEAVAVAVVRTDPWTRVKSGRSGIELVVRGPRIPCRVFAGFLDVPDLVKRFLAARRPGCYLAVESAGEVRAGDPATVVHRPGHGVTAVDLMAAMTGERAVLPRVRTARPDLGVRGREWLAGVGG